MWATDGGTQEYPRSSLRHHRNRLANVDAFEEINRLSREILIKSKDILQGLGYELLYADTDSVFLKKSGATYEDFVYVKDMLAREQDFQ